MTSIHGEDQVKAIKVGIDHRAGDGVDDESVFPAHASGARVGLVAFVIAVGARRVDFEMRQHARLLGQRPEQGFGQGRATDVARADEQQALWFGFFARHRPRDLSGCI